jgi:hypothetical protein
MFRSKLFTTLFFVGLINCLMSCNYYSLPLKINTQGISGSDFYKTIQGSDWRLRDSLVIEKVMSGNIPKFYSSFTPVRSTWINKQKELIPITYFVAKDYLSIGTNNDFARVPITPMAAQKIADSLHCFLPTPKMVDEIYEQSKIKLAPVPLYIYRDSSISMWQHHLIIEGQRKNRKGLISGIKKDVVLSNKVLLQGKNNRVAIYGWHQLNGKVIQPIYAGHVNWYVDYSHGIRLVYEKIKVNGHWMHYQDILKDSALSGILTNEEAPLLLKY